MMNIVRNTFVAIVFVGLILLAYELGAAFINIVKVISNG